MKVGIIGAGTMGNAHAKGWQKSGAEFVGVSAKNKESAKQLAETYGIKAYDNHQDLLEAVDIIDLCVPSDLHKDMVLEAARAKKHIICEKPIALTLEDAEAMIAACNKAGVRLFIAMVVRFFPQYRAAKAAIDAGQLGELGVIRLKRIGYQPLGDEAWFTDDKRSGGMIVDLMLHDLDYARSIAGEVKRVYAKSIRSTVNDAPGDYALITLGFESGAMALIEGGWAYPPGFFRTGIDIAGSEGLIEWQSDDSQTIKPFLKPQERTKVARVGIPSSSIAEDPYVTEIKHAYEAIRDNKPFLVSPEDGLEALRLALAAKESLKTGQVVFLGGN
ncbi:MAG: Gfo/Idh/MocA family oxidoreductase [Trueperaceae bacterium]|nr:Gfo/Idh/MocA family oxidoreductase [Trueperaceae bacterium]